MFKNNNIMLIAIVCVSMSLHAGESWVQSITNIFFSSDLYTRHQLYKKLKGRRTDYEVQVNIVDNQEYYLDMIEESILKREHNGSKEGKIVDPFKIGYGMAQLSALIITCCALDYYKIEYPDTHTVPVALLWAGLGLRNLYKGIFYKNRMERKLERDKLARRTMREFVGHL